MYAFSDHREEHDLTGLASQHQSETEDKGH